MCFAGVIEPVRVAAGRVTYINLKLIRGTFRGRLEFFQLTTNSECGNGKGKETIN